MDRIRDILARFPENESAVRQLIQDSQVFDALCQQYADTDRELRIARTENGETSPEARILHDRRGAIEEEILTMIEGYAPV
ncbi:MAG: hypothetical protein E5W82_33970 [Mesorhizobium sp.]|nr:MAG: hypothetical protein E5W82_33970 [Mesorhizobium sp.]TJW42085.1 MAG: hypothetical protein E5W83_23150 [Mesorhizobium sp.]